MRDDFSKITKEKLAKRVGGLCSNPGCRKLTSGPHIDPSKFVNRGVAAHITAASPGGKRYDPEISPKARRDISNGIWLCQNCAKLIDDDEIRYSISLLRKWKEEAESAAILEIENPAYQLTRNETSNSKKLVDWHQISRKNLNFQDRLTTNFLTRIEGISHQTSKVSIPLNLREYKKPVKRQKNSLFTQDLNSITEEKISQILNYESFLEKIIHKKKELMCGGDRIAIIGEPGAGKTTFLQQLALWISEKLEQPVIWVALSSLQGITLEEYLLEQWLRNSLEVLNVAPEKENSFVEWFKQSQVWLLLDGVDEVPSEDYNFSLDIIVSQIQGWIGKAQIILTCRQNLWDNYAHHTEQFDTYSLLPLSYPNQVEEFIRKWFSRCPKQEDNKVKIFA